MLMAWVALISGLVCLVWSADKFVDGASASARYAGVSPLLIGMVIIGFGTSAPEMVVSAIASLNGNPGLALGNAYGSNITNIGLVVGLVATISPIRVQSRIITKELPLLFAVTLLAGWQLLDGELSRLDSFVLLGVFILIMGWSIVQGRVNPVDSLESEYINEIDSHPLSLRLAVIWIIVGLVLLIISSRLLVWGAVIIAQSFGISDLIIGLTVVAVGTSLPELASALAAIRKNEHELALGNVLGSGLFNTLVVVGIAAGIHPILVGVEVLYRDWGFMVALTLLLFIMGAGWRNCKKLISRFNGCVLLISYIGYTVYLISLVLR